MKVKFLELDTVKGFIAIQVRDRGIKSTTSAVVNKFVMNTIISRYRNLFNEEMDAKDIPFTLVEFRKPIYKVNENTGIPYIYEAWSGSRLSDWASDKLQAKDDFRIVRKVDKIHSVVNSLLDFTDKVKQSK